MTATSTSFKQGLWTGLPTPWTEREELNREVFRDTLDACACNASDGIYMAGTTGEVHSMDDRLFAQVVEVFTETMRKHPDVAIQVGCGGHSLRQTLERARISFEHGCKDLQVGLPGWLTLTDDEVVAYYKTIAERFPEARICVYDTAASGRNIEARLWPRLLREVPAIRGAKLTKVSAELLEQMRSEMPDFMPFATESNLMQSWPHGVRAVTVWITYAFPRFITELWTALEKNDQQGIATGTARLETLSAIKETIRSYGYRGGIIDRLMGLASGFLHPAFHRVLGPWRSVDPEHVAQVRQRLIDEFGAEALTKSLR